MTSDRAKTMDEGLGRTTPSANVHAFLLYRVEAQSDVSRLKKVLATRGVDFFELISSRPEGFSDVMGVVEWLQATKVLILLSLVVVVGVEWEIWEKRDELEILLHDLPGRRVCLLLLPGAEQSKLPHRVPWDVAIQLTEESSWIEELAPLIPALTMPPQAEVVPIDVSGILGPADPATAF